jgi:hypothetical protein
LDSTEGNDDETSGEVATTIADHQISSSFFFFIWSAPYLR